MTDRIRIVVADDHPLVRGGVVRSLLEQGGFDVIAEAGTAAEALAAVEDALPDVVLLDISMPGSGLTAAAEIGRRFPAVGIVMLTVSEADEDLLAALKAGAPQSCPTTCAFSTPKNRINCSTSFTSAAMV